MKSPRKILALVAFLSALPAQARIPFTHRPPPGLIPSRHTSPLQLTRTCLFRVRGGELSDDESDTDAHSENDDLSEGDNSDIEIAADGDVTEADDEQEVAAESSLTGPVKLVIKTNLNCPISDQTLEFTASGKRTIESVKQGTCCALCSSVLFVGHQIS